MKERTLFLVLACFLAGLTGEAILQLESQSRGVENQLLEDFRIILFLKPNLPEGRLKVVEEKLGALEGVESLRYVSAEESLEQLLEAEPELARSAAALGGNPLPASFEARPSASAMTRVARLSDEMLELSDIADVRYKPHQLRAILKAQYYGRFLRLLLNAAFCLAGFAAAAGLWSLREGAPRPRPAEAALAAGAATLGMISCALLIYPMRELAPGAWPGFFIQFMLLAGITGLFTLCPRS